MLSEKDRERIYLICGEISYLISRFLDLDLSNIEDSKLKEMSKHVQEIAKRAELSTLQIMILSLKKSLVEGDFSWFKEILEQFNEKKLRKEDVEAKIWRDLFNLLLKFIENPLDTTILEEIQKKQKELRSKNFHSISDKIDFYTKLISSKKISEELEDRFKETFFHDI